MRRDSPDDGDFPTGYRIGPPMRPAPLNSAEISTSCVMFETAATRSDRLTVRDDPSLNGLAVRLASDARSDQRLMIRREVIGREELAMLEGVSVPVAGPSVIFPRGYLWFAPLWSAVALGYIALSHWPLWFRADLAGALLIGLTTIVITIASLTFRAFSADQDGVRLGLPSSTKRRGRRRRTVRYLPWQQLERVRIARRPGGVRLEFILGDNATLAVRGYHPNPALAVINRILLLVIPFWYLVRSTGLTSPLEGPARYRVILRDTTVEEMRHALRTLAPPDVTIAVLVRRRTSVSSARAVLPD